MTPLHPLTLEALQHRLDVALDDDHENASIQAAASLERVIASPCRETLRTEPPAIESIQNILDIGRDNYPHADTAEKRDITRTINAIEADIG